MLVVISANARKRRKIKVKRTRKVNLKEISRILKKTKRRIGAKEIRKEVEMTKNFWLKSMPIR